MMIGTLLLATLLASVCLGDQLVCNTRNETCVLKSRELDDFPIVNFTFVLEDPQNVTHIRFEESEINEIPKLLVDKFEYLRVLDVRFCELKRFKKPILEKAKNLIELDLSFNKLKRLEDSSFSGAEKLLSLNLFRNEIVEAHVKAFNGLNNLEKLDLASNELRRLKVGIFDLLPSLVELDVKKNKLEVLGKVLVNLTRLELLDLSYNKLRKLEADAFTNLTKLEVIDLCYNRLEEVDPLAFETNVNLKAINFQNNKLVQIELRFFSSSLFILDISKNHLTNLTASGISEMSLTLDSNSIRSLQLDMDINRLVISENHLETLELLKGLQSAFVIDVSHNQFKEANQSFPKDLKKLIAHNVSMENSDAIQTFLSSLVPPTIVELDVSLNDLSELKWSSLPTFRSLKKLNLVNCSITSLDGVSFAFPKVQQVFLAGNPVSCQTLEEQYDSDNLKCISSLGLVKH